LVNHHHSGAVKHHADKVGHINLCALFAVAGGNVVDTGRHLDVRWVVGILPPDNLAELGKIQELLIENQGPGFHADLVKQRTVKHKALICPGRMPEQVQGVAVVVVLCRGDVVKLGAPLHPAGKGFQVGGKPRSEEHTSELQSRFDLVCRLLLEKKKTIKRHKR